MPGAKHIGAGRIGESAGTFALRGGFEHAGIGTGITNRASFCVYAVGDASDSPEYDAKSSAQNIGCLSRRKIKRL
jgi:hypothetical protein